jgi:hypothetical protein
VLSVVSAGGVGEGGSEWRNRRALAGGLPPDRRSSACCSVAVSPRNWVRAILLNQGTAPDPNSAIPVPPIQNMWRKLVPLCCIVSPRGGSSRVWGCLNLCVMLWASMFSLSYLG